jgi:RNA polymerase sigma factor (sigma-70 family)
MTPDDLDSVALGNLMNRARSGDFDARDELVRRSQRRLELLARKMLRGFPTVHRWEETLDVLQNSMIRLLRSLEEVTPQTTREFFGLAAEQIRRELIDLTRHYQGPHGHARHHRSGVIDNEDKIVKVPDIADDRPDPTELERWTAFHCAVERLPVEEREVFMLSFYHGWTQPRIAELFEVDERTIRRRWKAAGEKLQAVLAEQSSDPNL